MSIVGQTARRGYRRIGVLLAQPVFVLLVVAPRLAAAQAAEPTAPVSGFESERASPDDASEDENAGSDAPKFSRGTRLTAGYVGLDARFGQPNYFDSRPYLYPTTGARVERDAAMFDVETHMLVYLVDLYICGLAIFGHQNFGSGGESGTVDLLCMGIENLFNPHLHTTQDEPAHVTTGHTSLARYDGRITVHDAGSLKVGVGGTVFGDLLYIDRDSPGLSSLMGSAGPSVGVRRRDGFWAWSVSAAGGLSWDLGDVQLCLFGSCRGSRDFVDPHLFTGLRFRSEWSVAEETSIYVRPEVFVRWLTTVETTSGATRNHRLWTGGLQAGVVVE